MSFKFISFPITKKKSMMQLELRLQFLTLHLKGCACCQHFHFKIFPQFSGTKKASALKVVEVNTGIQIDIFFYFNMIIFKVIFFKKETYIHFHIFSNNIQISRFRPTKIFALLFHILFFKVSAYY